ncbi:MAG: hypothetical protein LBJ08_00135, partial [Bifidobacteriaceae bacterium]|nr:hypothetical protein [Bifidobacteriaceae bacterium]
MNHPSHLSTGRSPQSSGRSGPAHRARWRRSTIAATTALVLGVGALVATAAPTVLPTPDLAAAAAAPAAPIARLAAAATSDSTVILDGGIKVNVSRTEVNNSDIGAGGLDISFNISLANLDGTPYTGTPAREGDVSVSYRILAGSLKEGYHLTRGSDTAASGTLTIRNGDTRSLSETVTLRYHDPNIAANGPDSRWLGPRSFFIQFSNPVGAPIVAWPADGQSALAQDKIGGLVAVSVIGDFAMLNYRVTDPSGSRGIDGDNCASMGHPPGWTCYLPFGEDPQRRIPPASAQSFAEADGVAFPEGTRVSAHLNSLSWTRAEGSNTCDFTVAAAFPPNNSAEDWIIGEVHSGTGTYSGGTCGVGLSGAPGTAVDFGDFYIPPGREWSGLVFEIDGEIRANTRPHDMDLGVLVSDEFPAPHVVAVSVPSLGGDTYKAGTTVPVTVDFSQPVMMFAGEAYLRLSPTSPARYKVTQPNNKGYSGSPIGGYEYPISSSVTYGFTIPADAEVDDFSHAVIEFDVLGDYANVRSILRWYNLDQNQGDRTVSGLAGTHEPNRAFGPLVQQGYPWSPDVEIVLQATTQNGPDARHWLLQESQWTQNPDGTRVMDNIAIRALNSGVDYPLTMGGTGQDEGSVFEARISARDIDTRETYILIRRESLSAPWRYVPSVEARTITANWAPRYATEASLVTDLYPAGGVYYTGDLEANLAARIGPVDNTAAVTWTSSDPTVATVAGGNPTGDRTVRPAQVAFTGKPGAVSFTATVSNTSTQIFATLTTPQFQVTDGASAPTVTFVGTQRTPVAAQNQPLLVSWSENIRARDPSARFLVEVFEGDHAAPDQIPAGARRVFAQIVNGLNATTIPAGTLSTLSDSGAPAYTVRVEISSTSVSGARTPAVAPIVVVPANASVAIARLDRYAITDTTAEVPISWAFENAIGGHTEFSLTVKRGDDVLATLTDPAQTTYTLPITKVPQDKIKEVYSLQAAVRNDTDPAGYLGKDSAVIEVYRDGSLAMLANGQETGQVTLGVDYQDGMSVQQIRDLAGLSAALTVNYADFNNSAGTVSDRVRWDSSNASAIAVGHKTTQGFASIGDLGYTTYSPYDKMLLAGLEDGRAVIQVTHAATGLTDDIEVDVTTLRNKLYLFTFDKPQPFTLTWTNGNGNRTVKVFGPDGTAVIYEESGIASDVKAVWRDEDDPDGATTYKAQVAQANLESGAGNPLLNEPFTTNIARTRALPKLPLSLKDEQGNAYTGPVVVRGAAFRGGQLCPDTVEDNALAQAWTPDASGRLMVSFDEQDMTAPGEKLTADDVIELVIEVTPVDTSYRPALVAVTTSDPATLQEKAAPGVVNLAKVPAGPAVPFLARITHDVGDPAVPVQAPGEGVEHIGPSNMYPDQTLKTVVSWAGTGLAAGTGAVEAKSSISAEGRALTGQTSSVANYPFTANKYTLITTRLTADTLQSGGVGKGQTAIGHIKVYREGSSTPAAAIPLAFDLVNLVGVTEATKDPTLQADADAAVASVEAMLQGGNSTESGGTGNVLSDTTQKVLGRVSSNFGVGKASFTVVATEDPMVLRGTLQVGVALNGDGEPDIAFDVGGMEAELKLVPTPADIQGLVELAANPMSALMPFEYGYNYGVKGGLDIEFRWVPEPGNSSGGHWTLGVVGGQVSGFGSVNARAFMNLPVLIIPVTASASVEAKIEAGVRITRPSTAPSQLDRPASSLTDIFITWNAQVAVGLFVGVGFDSSVVTAKVGVEGTLTGKLEGRYLMRSYMGSLQSSVQANSRTYPLKSLNSHTFGLDGKLAIKAVVKVLFVEGSITLISWEFSKDLWKSGAYDLIDQWVRDNGVKLAGVQPTADGGATVYTVEPAVLTTQSRDYLKTAAGTPSAAGAGLSSLATPSSLLAAALGPEASILDETQYPYAAPQTTRDGQLVAYLSDQGSTDVNDTRVYYTAAGSTDTEAHILSDPTADAQNNPSGAALPDADLVMDGTQSFQAAAWVRSKDAIPAQVTDATVLDMMADTEIYAAVHTGGVGGAHAPWSVTRLTDNSAADVGPQVAALGTRAVVAWTSPQGSGVDLEGVDQAGGINLEGMFQYNDLGDKLQVKVFDGNDWDTDPITVYTSAAAGGAVKGLNTAMLDNNTAAIAYQVDLSEGEASDTGSEIRVAVVKLDSRSVVSDLRLTNNATPDTNPQVTVAEIDGAKRFVVAWHAVDEFSGSDIRVETINPDGTVYSGFITSIALADDDTSVGETFRFVRGDNLDVRSLALVTATNPEATPDGVGRGQVKVIRFAQYGGEVLPSPAVSIVTYAPGEVAEHIDAYTAPGTERICVHALVTEYSADADPASGYSYDCGRADNAITVDDVSVPADEVIPGMRLEVPFTVRNTGVGVIESVRVSGFGATPTIIDGLAIAPGRSEVVWMPYTVPATVVDVQWALIATFDAGGLGGAGTPSVRGTLRLAVPDLGISQAAIVASGQSKRTVRIAAYNASTAALPAGAKAQVGLYTDGEFTASSEVDSVTL